MLIRASDHTVVREAFQDSPLLRDDWLNTTRADKFLGGVFKTSLANGEIYLNLIRPSLPGDMAYQNQAVLLHSRGGNKKKLMVDHLLLSCSKQPH